MGSEMCIRDSGYSTRKDFYFEALRNDKRVFGESKGFFKFRSGTFRFFILGFFIYYCLSYVFDDEMTFARFSQDLTKKFKPENFSSKKHFSGKHQIS